MLTGAQMATTDGEYYEDVVIFKVEDKLFKVRKEQLVRHSPVFRNMFEIPQGRDPSSVLEGTDNGHPICIDGVTESGFKALLRVLYPRIADEAYICGIEEPFQFNKLSLEDWFAVHRLASMWLMDIIKDLAISEINARVFRGSPVEKILYGRKYNREDWLLSGYRYFVRKMEITPGEAQEIGVETALMLLSFGAKSMARSAEYDTPPTRDLGRELSVDNEVKTIRMAKKRGESFAPAKDKMGDTTDTDAIRINDFRAGHPWRRVKKEKGDLDTIQ